MALLDGVNRSGAQGVEHGPAAFRPQLVNRNVPEPMLAPPKTESSHRTIPRASFVVDALADYPRRFPPESGELVLRHPSGGPVALRHGDGSRASDCGNLIRT